LRHLPILSRLLEQARRRAITQLVIEKAVIALIVLLAGAIVLLLAGTQILDWYWIALLAVASLGVGIYQLRGHIPSFYQIAQRIDRRLGLADALSTAFHFALNPDPLRESIAERQARDANESAGAVDASQAIPFSRPKHLTVAAVLLAVALGLFGVRYLVTGNLSLEPSLVRIALDTFFGGNTKLAKNNATPVGLRQEPFDPGSPDNASKGDEQKDEDSTSGFDQPDNANANGDQLDDQQDLQTDSPGQDAAGNDKQDGNQNKQADQNSKQQDGKQNGKQDNNQNGKAQDRQSSMLDKLRDALSNMMKGNKSNDSQQQQGKQNGKQDKSNESQDASAQGESQGDQQQAQSSGSQKTGEGKQDQNGADSKSDQKAGEKASQDAKNGIGSADGDKKAREAAMLEAMGKIEELLGKRQQNITGEMMIEVQQTKQQLKTPWMQSQGAHGESGGEIHRDEVPPMVQQFVEQYFEEIRKPQPGAAKADPAAAKPARPAAARP
jgi:hypothetical protein